MSNFRFLSKFRHQFIAGFQLPQTPYRGFTPWTPPGDFCPREPPSRCVGLIPKYDTGCLLAYTTCAEASLHDYQSIN